MGNASRRLVFVVALVLGCWLALAWWGLRREGRSTSTHGSIENVSSADTPVELAQLPAVERHVAESVTRKPSVVDERGNSATPAKPNTGEVTGALRSALPTEMLDRGTARLLPPVDPSAPTDPAARMALNTARGGALIQTDGSFRIPNVDPGTWRLVVAAPGFEDHEEVVRVEVGGVTHVTALLMPMWTTPLTIRLQNTSGRPLFRALDGDDLELARSLRLLLLEECPPVGASLTKRAQWLTQKTMEVGADEQDSWKRVVFKKPTGGCACVALGDRVLDAVAFAPGQSYVVLTVDPAALGAHMCSLELDVRADDAARTPLPGAWVTLSPKFGRTVIVHPDGAGRVHAERLPAGDVDVVVKLAGYADASRRITLTPGAPVRTEVILLSKSGSIGGRVIFPNPELRTVLVSLVRVETDGTAIVVMNQSTATDHDDFQFIRLHAADYMVGIMSASSPPDPDEVRRNAVEGWRWIPLRSGAEVATQLILSDELWSSARAVTEPLRVRR